MLHAIDAQGNIQWHCISMPQCSYHNCEVWDKEIRACSHHATRVSGQTHTAHISDPGVIWLSNTTIRTPICDECGAFTMLEIHENVIEPIIKRDEITGKILQVVMPPGYEHYHTLWIADANTIRKTVPHPTMAHLTAEQIKQQQELLRSVAPDAPVDWMQQEMIIEDIHNVYPHPAVERHRSLAGQLRASGKVYVPPKEETPEPMYTSSQVKEIVTNLLQQHGLITAPRLPIVNPNETT